LDRKKLLIVLIAGVAALGLLLLGYFVFLLETVAVDGNETYSDASIVELSGFHAGTHLLLCDLDKAKAGVRGKSLSQGAFDTQGAAAHHPHIRRGTQRGCGYRWAGVRRHNR
jgi:hypothetical protein